MVSMTTTDPVREVVVERLSQLEGLDSDGIASKLREAGIKGECGSASRCAIAEFLVDGIIQARLSFETVLVSPSWAGVRKPGDLVGAGVRVPLAPEIRRFIADFDSKRYPELITTK